ncbi:transporter [Acetivibrio straminisolvens JCM 21531]|uniref:Transporter n=1 Tax=Acetivibrio straminisolvens JCM 21531 TaxID=1294263 RepID=W4V7S0_9FIRM|nr:transporter [Acetivibrio straminisolvens JCM 21531]
MYLLSFNCGIYFGFRLSTIVSESSRNKVLVVLFLVTAGVVGCGALWFVKKALNLHILNNEGLRVLFIVLMSLITRLVLINIVDITPNSDFELYHTLAQAFSKGEGAGGKYVALFPHTFGYPFILGMVYRVFSPDKYFALLLNILFEAVTGILIYFLGKMISNWKVGFFAAIIWLYGPLMCFTLQLFVQSRYTHC